MAYFHCINGPIVATSRFFIKDTAATNITNYCTVHNAAMYLLAAHSVEPAVESTHFLELMNLLLKDPHGNRKWLNKLINNVSLTSLEG